MIKVLANSHHMMQIRWLANHILQISNGGENRGTSHYSHLTPVSILSGNLGLEEIKEYK